MSKRAALGCAADRTGLGGGAGRIGEAVSKRAALGSTADRTGLGSGAGSIGEAMSKRAALGCAADRTGLGGGAGRIGEAVSKRAALGSTADRTGLGSGAGRIGEAMTKRAALGCAANRTGLGGGAGRIGEAMTNHGHRLGFRSSARGAGLCLRALCGAGGRSSHYPIAVAMSACGYVVIYVCIAAGRAGVGCITLFRAGRGCHDGNVAMLGVGHHRVSRARSAYLTRGGRYALVHIADGEIILNSVGTARAFSPVLTVLGPPVGDSMLCGVENVNGVCRM